MLHALGELPRPVLHRKIISTQTSQDNCFDPEQRVVNLYTGVVQEANQLAEPRFESTCVAGHTETQDERIAMSSCLCLGLIQTPMWRAMHKIMQMKKQRFVQICLESPKRQHRESNHHDSGIHSKTEQMGSIKKNITDERTTFC